MIGYLDVFQSKKVKSNCSSPWVNLACMLYTHVFQKKPYICQSLFSIKLQSFSMRFYQINCIMDILEWILKNIFSRTHFLQDSSGQMLVIFRKGTFKLFFTRSKLYCHTIFDLDLMSRNDPQNFKNRNHSWCFRTSIF